MGRFNRETVLDTSNNSRLYASEYGYDANNNINKIGVIAGNTGVSMTYTYGTDNLPTAYTAGANSGTYTYDELNRLKTKTSSITPTVSYNYKSGTAMVEQEYVGGDTTSYSYDANGNITSLMAGGKAIFYQYDEFNRLVAELNKHTDQTTIYKYDAWGNIAMKWLYSGSNTYTPDSVNLIKKYDYVYSSSTDMAWKDLMTEYDGQTITYDEIGNPTSYMGSTMYWEGRTLVEQIKNGTTITYSYDSSNMRTSKTVGGVKHNYYYVEGKLMYEDCPSYKLFYTYDANGFLSSIKRVKSNGVTETFGVHCNIFGDVIAIYEQGILIAKYSYDSWGKLISVTESNGLDVTGDNDIWTQNSIRYRGYVYDEETQLYYLQSRYYDPNTCRFINADDYSVLTASPSALSDKNLFAYCDCNPIVREDIQGDYWNIIVGAAIGGTVSLVSSFIFEIAEGNFEWKDVGQIAIATAIGTAEGAFTALCPTMSIAISAVASAAETAINSAIDGKSGSEIVVNSVISGSLGAITGASGSTIRKGGKLLNNAVDAIKTVSSKGVNPAVKKGAKKTVQNAAKAIRREYVSNQIEDISFGALDSFISFFARIIMNK